MSTHAPDTLPNRYSWADRAACQGKDLTLFFSDAEQKVKQAKAICAACPVRTTCLEEALHAEATSTTVDGIFGGLTADERTELARARKQAPPKPSPARRLAPCGTNSAYRRHQKKGEPIDQACRDAHAAACRRLRTTGTSKLPKED